MPGDDLIDDFVPDDLVHLSAEEDELDDSNPAIFSDIEDHTTARDTGTADEKSQSKKRKRREKEKQRKKTKLLESAEEQKSTATDTPQAQADYLASMQAKSFSKLSQLELEDMRIPVTSLVDTSSWAEGRSLESLPQFITQTIPTLHTRLLQRSKTNGAPTMIFIVSAALRAADAARILKSFVQPSPKSTNKGKKDDAKKGTAEKSEISKAGEVAKLFGKHFKLAEHKAYLEKTKVGSGVGTPGRVAKLLEEQALNVSQLSHLVLDVSFRDAKQRSLFEIPECRDDLFKMLSGEALSSRIKEGKLSIVLF